jgi:amino acid transporter
MNEWWSDLPGISRVFFGMAVFFSVFFIWQIIAAFMGMGGEDADAGGFDADAGDADVGDFDAPDNVDHHDVIESSQAFRIVSLRSIITFFTLFSWMGALYTAKGMAVGVALTLATLWGVVGMFVVAFIFYGMNKLTETGTKDVATCKGQVGTVYLDIPAQGFGEVKTVVSNAVEHVKAKSITGEPLPAGTEVRIEQVIGQTLVGVVKLTNKGE